MDLRNTISDNCVCNFVLDNVDGVEDDVDGEACRLVLMTSMG